MNISTIKQYFYIVHSNQVFKEGNSLQLERDSILNNSMKPSY